MNKNMPYKCLIPISMAYMSIMICSDLLVNKPVSMYFGYTTAATFVFPLWFVFNDIIAEVYGYKLCRKILLTGFVTQAFFNLICYSAVHLPSPLGWENQDAFELILGHLFRIALGTMTAFIISGFINIHLLTKWKVLMSGRYFWLRSIGSSAIGETIYSGLNVWAILLGTIPTSKIPIIMFWSLFLKLIYTIVMAYPAMILVEILKKVDGVDVYDYEFDSKLYKNNLEMP